MNTGASTYPDIGLGEVQTNTTTFNFAVDGSVACGVPLEFEIEAASDDGTFNRRERYDVEGKPLGVSIGDLNNDGFDDMLMSAPPSTPAPAEVAAVSPAAAPSAATDASAPKIRMTVMAAPPSLRRP